jgi:hypothetical protein
MIMMMMTLKKDGDTVAVYSANQGDASVNETKLVCDDAPSHYRMERLKHAELTEWAVGYHEVRRELKEPGSRSATAG